MSGGVLNDAQWASVQDLVPIVCVDMLPVRERPSGMQVGLILRATPHQGRRWCLIGGRVRLDETLIEAAHRHWTDAVGDSLPFRLLEAPIVVEYAKDALSGRPHDPRKNAIAVTYRAQADGLATARGAEALDFRWFQAAELDEQVMGFGQEVVVNRLLSAPTPLTSA